MKNLNEKELTNTNAGGAQSESLQEGLTNILSVGSLLSGYSMFVGYSSSGAEAYMNSYNNGGYV